jgi:hypothetical protein
LTSSLIGLVKERVDDQGNVVSESLPPEQVFLDWVYAIYLHDDEDRLARLADWDPIPVHRFNFLQMAGDLSRAYYGFSGIPREVLTEPTLLPADTSAA